MARGPSPSAALSFIFCMTQPTLSDPSIAPRLVLRPWHEEDAPLLFDYASDPEVGPLAGWPPHASLEESLQVIREIFSNGHTWAVSLLPDLHPIGCMGYYLPHESNIPIGPHDCEVGYWIARPYWNRGLCSEALRLLISHCFSQEGFSVLWADHFLHNPASGAVLRRCGFCDTGCVNTVSRLLGGDRDLVRIYRLTRDLQPGT